MKGKVPASRHSRGLDQSQYEASSEESHVDATPWWIGRGVGRFRLDIEDFQIPSDQATDYIDNPSMRAAFSSNLSCSKWVSI